MGRSHATLSGLLRHQEEVEADIVVLVFNEAVVDDAPGRWVVDSRAVPHEHPLVDALVDDHQRDWGRPRGIGVEAPEHFSELGDLLVDDLVPHAFADTISVNNNFGWLLAIVVLGERADRLFHALVQFSFDELLVFLLKEESRKVLGLLFVDGRCEANDRVLTGVANVNADDHDSLLLEDSGELGSDGLAVQLGVDLLHNIGGMGKIHFVRRRPEHHLGQNALAGIRVFGDLVVLLVAQDLNGEELRLLVLRRGLSFHLG